MSDARTKIEILYKDVLGDMTELVSKVEALQESLPNTVKQTEHDLEGIVGKLLVAAKRFDSAIIAKTNEVANDALSKVRGQVVEEKNNALGDVRKEVREAIQLPIIDLVRDLKIAVNKVNDKPNSILKTAIVAGLLSGFVAGVIVLVGTVYYFTKTTEAAGLVQTESASPVKSTKGR